MAEDDIDIELIPPCARLTVGLIRQAKAEAIKGSADFEEFQFVYITMRGERFTPDQVEEWAHAGIKVIDGDAIREAFNNCCTIEIERVEINGITFVDHRKIANMAADAQQPQWPRGLIDPQPSYRERFPNDPVRHRKLRKGRGRE